MRRCPECGSTELHYTWNKAERHCANCGLVVEDAMPDMSGYREGTSVTAPIMIDGKVVKHQWLYKCKEKNLARARRKLETLRSRLNLPKYIKEQAYALYRRAVDDNLCVGRANRIILYASVYVVCKQNHLPKTPAEIVEYSDISRIQLMRAYRLLVKAFSLKVESIDPVDLLPRFMGNLGLSNDSLNKASAILIRLRNKPCCVGKNPQSLVAAAIYLAAKANKEKITQRDIANEVCLLETTIRKRYKEMEKEL